MPRIVTTIDICAPIGRCFDLARSIDFHQQSMSGSGERAVAGVTTGLIGLGQEVTWSGRHFGITQRLTSRITEFAHPVRFVDEQVRGAFAFFRHEHRFGSAESGLTRCTDTFEFASPFGPIGRAIDAALLKRYMTGLLRGHAERLRAALESEDWRRFLPS